MSKVTEFSIEKPGLIYSDAVRSLQEEQLWVSQKNSIELVEILGQQAEGLRRLSKLDGAQELFRRTLQVARHADVRWGECWSLWGLASVFRAKGRYLLSYRMFSSALEASKSVNDKRCSLWSMAELSELDRIAGNLEKAAASHKKLRHDFYCIGDWKGVCWASLGLAQIYRLRRDFDNSIIEFERAQDIALAGGNVVGAAWAVRGMAEVARENGDYQTSEKLAINARSDFLSVGYSLGAAYALKSHVEATLEDGRLMEALSLGTQCQAEFLNCGERRGVGFSLLTMGRILLSLHELPQAAYVLEKARHYIAHPSGREPNCFSPSAILRRIYMTHRNIRPYRLEQRHFSAHLLQDNTESTLRAGLNKSKLRLLLFSPSS